MDNISNNNFINDTVLNDWSIMATDDNKSIIDTKNIFISKNNNITNDSYNDINKNDDITLLTNCDLLEKSIKISKYLKLNFNKKSIDTFIPTINKYIELLHDLIYELAIRSKLLTNKNIDDYKLQLLTKQQNKNISRKSYKFCNSGYKCKFYYSLNNLVCYSQHFVYDSVLYDILNMMNYIKNITNINTDDIDEIKKSINTITYVINHMHQELIQIKNINSPFYKDF
jgi:hypothetical protein